MKTEMKQSDAKIWGVYCHTNKINNKKYVGITCHGCGRWGANGQGYGTKLPIEKQSKFAKAINRYGWDNFDHEWLENNLTCQEAFEKEKFYVEKFNSYRKGYNSTAGGDGMTKDYFDMAIVKLDDKIIYSNIEVAAIYNKTSGRSIEYRAKDNNDQNFYKLCDIYENINIDKFKKIDNFPENFYNKKVYCITLNKMFENVDKAIEYFNDDKRIVRRINRTTLLRSINTFGTENHMYAGWIKNDNLLLFWKFYNEKNDIIKNYDLDIASKIIRLEDGKIFNSYDDIRKEYAGSRAIKNLGIKRDICFTARRKNDNLVSKFIWYTTYLENNFDIKKMKVMGNCSNIGEKVYNKELKRMFLSQYDAEIYFKSKNIDGINSKSIIRSINNGAKTHIYNIPLTWKIYEEDIDEIKNYEIEDFLKVKCIETEEIFKNQEETIKTVNNNGNKYNDYKFSPYLKNDFDLTREIFYNCKVYCKQLKRVFDNCVEAKDWLKQYNIIINEYNLLKSCIFKTHCGEIDNISFDWKIYDKNDEIKNYTPDYYAKVICITNGQIFSCVSEVAKHFNSTNGIIGRSIIKNQVVKGQRFMYLRDYENNQFNE